MKRYTTLALFALLLLGATPAQAQVPTTPEPALVNQHIADTYAERSPAWWNALGRQLTLTLDKPHAQVEVHALQNVIFFATHYRAQVKLNDAAPKLIEIYRWHPEREFRLMALAALHAIGDERAMETLGELLRREPNGPVRRLTVAALNDHYNHR